MASILAEAALGSGSAVGGDGRSPAAGVERLKPRSFPPPSLSPQGTDASSGVVTAGIPDSESIAARQLSNLQALLSSFKDNSTDTARILKELKNLRVVGGPGEEVVSLSRGGKPVNILHPWLAQWIKQLQAERPHLIKLPDAEVVEEVMQEMQIKREGEKRGSLSGPLPASFAHWIEGLSQASARNSRFASSAIDDDITAMVLEAALKKRDAAQQLRSKTPAREPRNLSLIEHMEQEQQRSRAASKIQSVFRSYSLRQASMLRQRALSRLTNLSMRSECNFPGTAPAIAGALEPNSSTMSHPVREDGSSLVAETSQPGISRSSSPICASTATPLSSMSQTSVTQSISSNGGGEAPGAQVGAEEAATGQRPIGLTCDAVLESLPSPTHEPHGGGAGTAATTESELCSLDDPAASKCSNLSTPKSMTCPTSSPIHRKSTTIAFKNEVCSDNPVASGLASLRTAAPSFMPQTAKQKAASRPSTSHKPFLAGSAARPRTAVSRPHTAARILAQGRSGEIKSGNTSLAAGGAVSGSRSTGEAAPESHSGEGKSPATSCPEKISPRLTGHKSAQQVMFSPPEEDSQRHLQALEEQIGAQCATNSSASFGSGAMDAALDGSSEAKSPAPCSSGIMDTALDGPSEAQSIVPTADGVVDAVLHEPPNKATQGALAVLGRKDSIWPGPSITELSSSLSTGTCTAAVGTYSSSAAFEQLGGDVTDEEANMGKNDGHPIRDRHASQGVAFTQNSVDTGVLVKRSPRAEPNFTLSPDTRNRQSSLCGALESLPTLDIPELDSLPHGWEQSGCKTAPPLRPLPPVAERGVVRVTSSSLLPRPPPVQLTAKSASFYDPTSSAAVCHPPSIQGPEDTDSASASRSASSSLQARSDQLNSSSPWNLRSQSLHRLSLGGAGKGGVSDSVGLEPTPPQGEPPNLRRVPSMEAGARKSPILGSDGVREPSNCTGVPSIGLGALRSPSLDLGGQRSPPTHSSMSSPLARPLQRSNTQDQYGTIRSPGSTCPGFRQDTHTVLRSPKSSSPGVRKDVCKMLCSPSSSSQVRQETYSPMPSPSSSGVSQDTHSPMASPSSSSGVRQETYSPMPSPSSPPLAHRRTPRQSPPGSLQPASLHPSPPEGTSLSSIRRPNVGTMRNKGQSMPRISCPGNISDPTTEAAAHPRGRSQDEFKLPSIH